MALVAVMRQDRERVEPPANALASGYLGPRPAASSREKFPDSRKRVLGPVSREILGRQETGLMSLAE